MDYLQTLHCELIQPRRLSLPDSIRHLHHNFAQHHSFSFLNILSTLFCRMSYLSSLHFDHTLFIAHIQLAKYCTHVKMGLILSLVSSSLHLLIVGNESRVADILCQTALKYAPHGFIHRQQYPLILAPISNNKHRSFIVSGEFCLLTCVLILVSVFCIAGSIVMGDGGITYLESIDSLSKSQIKQLLSGKETFVITLFYIYSFCPYSI
jgi:hypothetical protein